MTAALLFLIYPILNLTTKIVIWIVIISIIRLSSMFVAMKKYKTFASIHTCGNKITGIVLFLFPIFIPYINTNVLMHIICVVASISAMEELIIQLTSTKLELNKQSIFAK